MGRKIIILPFFNAAHFLEPFIRNWCEYIKPDKITLVEGLWPCGQDNITSPETMKFFMDKSTILSKTGRRSFDFEWVQEIVKRCNHLTEIELMEADYAHLDTFVAMRDAYTMEIDKYKPEDLIFPLEIDAFISKGVADFILDKANELGPGDGFGMRYISFFESPYVRQMHHGSPEDIFKTSDKCRRMAYRFGDGNKYKRFARDVAECKYQQELQFYRDPVVMHYEWIIPDPYFESKLLMMGWKKHDGTFSKNGGECMKIRSIIQGDSVQEGLDTIRKHRIMEVVVKDKFEHPPHLNEHPNFVRYMRE